MKRKELIRYLLKQEAKMVREGSRYTIFEKDRFRTEIPRHPEIVDELARKICKDLNIPFKG